MSDSFNAAERVHFAWNELQSAWAQYLGTVAETPLDSNPWMQATAEGIAFAMNAHSHVLIQLIGGEVATLSAGEMLDLEAERARVAGNN